MPRLTLHLLGPPRVQVDGQPATLRRRKALALLAYLAVPRQPHTRDALATLLWPGYGQTEARGHLRRALTAVRRELGQQWTVADRNSIALSQTAEIWTDVDHFRALAGSKAASLAALDEAATLYQDGFLAGFTLPDAPEFDAWQRYQGETLHNACLAVLDRLSQGYAVRGDYERAVTHARRRLKLDPAHEPTHRRLMKLYAALGQQSDALHQYASCSQALRDELGIEPSDETAALNDEIRGGRRRFFVDGSSASPTTALGDPLPAHNLPAQTTPFVGRQQELDALGQLLENPTNRLVTILGPGGMGKTRLALEMAALLIEEGFTSIQGGLFLVRLAKIGDAEHIVPAIAEALNYQFQSDSRSTQQQLLDYLGQKQLILVLDNFEHLLAGVDLIQAMLRTCPRLRLLVTSRERLQLLGETVFTLGSMDFPTWETPSSARQFSAIQLFWQSAQRVRAGWALQTDDIQYVARICRLVGGIPLGIILAATWIEVLSPQEIAAELTHGFDLLETGLHDLPERQRSMRAVLAHSWRMLDEAEREVFMRLAVFRGGCTRDAAQMVAGASLQSLARLAEKSFVQHSTHGRYDLHELLRQYGEAQLEEAGAASHTQAVHSTYYLDLLQRAESGLAGTDQLAVIAEIEADFENIRTAWQQAVQSNDYARVDRALDGLFRWCWLRRARQLDGLALLRFALAHWSPRPGEMPHPVWVRISVRAIEHQLGAWLTSFNRGAVEQGLALARQNGDRREIAFCQWLLGLVFVSEMHASVPASEIAPAIKLYKDSLTYFREVDDRFFVAQVLENLGHSLREMAQSDRAISCLEESLERRRLSGDRYSMARSLRELGFAFWLQGRKRETENVWRSALEIQRAHNEKQGIADSLFFLCVLSLNNGEWRRAVEMIDDVLSITAEIENPFYRSWGERAMMIATAMEQDVRKSGHETCAHPNAVSPFSARFFFALFTANPARLGHYLNLLWNLAESKEDTAVCLPLAARHLAAKGEVEEATSVLALAYEQPSVASGWIGLLPEFDELKQVLQGQLSQAAFARAWRQGQELDLEHTVTSLRQAVQTLPALPPLTG